MDSSEIEYLYQRCISNKATTDERKRLLLLLSVPENEAFARQMLQRAYGDVKDTADVPLEVSQSLLESIFQSDQYTAPSKELDSAGATRKMHPFKRRNFWIAASVILVFLSATYLLLQRTPLKSVARNAIKGSTHKIDIVPGGNKAVLTLADGSAITLDDAGNGELARQGNTRVLKINGKLMYSASPHSANENLLNTISTPRGGQYQVELPDGSLVWLNAASSMRFPATFTGKERRVEITGEAYFEVAKAYDKDRRKLPFTVVVNTSEIRVLGTHFNVMAYGDETAVKTTLAEGAVSFISNKTSTLLKPGQQSQLLKSGQVKVLNGIDVNGVLAWKNGMFHFSGDDIQTVMRQVSRWYNADVVYDKEVAEIFYGKIPRNTNLADLLKALELTGKVKFIVKDGKIIVTK